MTAEVTLEKITFPDSESVTEASYDPQNKELFVTFRKGTQYVYFDVPSDLFARFAKADSAGKFVHKEIIGKFRYGKIF